MNVISHRFKMMSEMTSVMKYGFRKHFIVLDWTEWVFRSSYGRQVDRLTPTKDVVLDGGSL